MPAVGDRPELIVDVFLLLLDDLRCGVRVVVVGNRIVACLEGQGISIRQYDVPGGKTGLDPKGTYDASISHGDEEFADVACAFDGCDGMVRESIRECGYPSASVAASANDGSATLEPPVVADEDVSIRLLFLRCRNSIGQFHEQGRTITFPQTGYVHTVQSAQGFFHMYPIDWNAHIWTMCREVNVYCWVRGYVSKILPFRIESDAVIPTSWNKAIFRK